jgi:peptidoglycan/xylan/chitin deacetylase (PgdA/CDA1 family)
MRRVIPALAVPLAAAAVVGALPALTARGPARRLTPDPDGTPAVFDTLAGLAWHATFFMLGAQVRPPGRVDPRIRRS